MDDYHVSTEAVELYALGRLAEPEACAVEEHLLVCEQCQQAVAFEDATIESIKEVMRNHLGSTSVAAEAPNSDAPNAALGANRSG